MNARITEANFYQNNFDLVRLFAACQVMLFHCAAHLDLIVPFPFSLLASFPGVQIFFVTSGFLIAASYDRSSSDLVYFEKRFLRLFPALWVCIIATFAILVVIGYPLANWDGLLWVVSQMAAIIYTPEVVKPFGFGSYNGSLWTIPLELQFYVTVPVLYRLLAHRVYERAFLISLFLLFLGIGLSARLAFPSFLGTSMVESVGVKLLRYSFIPHYFEFLAGFVAYRFCLWTHWAIAGRAIPWIIVVVAFSLLAGDSGWASIAGNLLMIGCTLACAYTPVMLNQRLIGNDLSYGIYIYHGLLLNLALTMGFYHRWAGVALVILVSFPVAAASWYLVERPSLRIKGMLPNRHAVA